MQSQSSNKSRLTESEQSRRKKDNIKNKHKVMLLDPTHMKLLRKKENYKRKELYQPEGYSTDHKEELARLFETRSAKSHYYFDPMSTMDHNQCMQRGLGYKFKLRDLHKYSAKWSFRDINWKLKFSALGKLIPDVKQRKKILIKASHLNTLLRLLKQTDWSQTPVYFQFLRNGRWKHEDENIYSANELEYNTSYINKLLNNANHEEMTKENTKSINDLYLEKTMKTMSVLMNQMNLMYYWEKL